MMNASSLSGLYKIDVRLTTNTKCEDCNLRPFCFSITDYTNHPEGYAIYYATENIAEKEVWTEAIQASISLIHLSAAKDRMKQLALSNRKSSHESEGGEGRSDINIGTESLKHDEEKIRSLMQNKFNQYNSRPLIYMKVVQIRNLSLSKDNALVYVKVTLGASTVETTSRSYSEILDWGMVFPFDWDRLVVHSLFII